MNETTIGKHCQTVYSLLAKQAKSEQFADELQLVFRGSYTKVFSESGISNSYYRIVKRIMTELGSITEVRRGSRNVESIILLHGPPKVEDADIIALKDLTPAQKGATLLEQRVKDIEANIGGLDIKKALADIQRQINTLKGSNGKK